MSRVGRLVLLLSAIVIGYLQPPAAEAGQAPGASRPAAPMQAPADAKAFSPTLEDVPYPYPVHYLPLTLYGHDVRMAYMDVPADAAASGRTVVLLHGMNFYGEYWTDTIAVLHKQGFRVIVPDQVGFGRSSKPIMPYTLSDMAMNTRTLLERVGVQKAAIVGHSMGGMVATRFALLYPDVTERLVLYNQIGLTDARLQRPPTPTDEVYKQLLGETYDQVYHGLARYFPSGVVPPDFEKYVRRQYGWTLSGNWPEAAMVRALVQQMVYEDPVVYDWSHIKVKTLEIGGDKDGPDFPTLARHVADTIPGAQLVLIPGVGHVPHVQSPDIFHRELLKFLAS
ncbi:MAG TPA: alpha/beta hydrolase [Vicinamibacterales bacterium]|jgi:pimeloyl-ACP methyl ester carboxylesterase|nr:alpha/beta hydrolase [Vicinamibacterales bacterium]